MRWFLYAPLQLLIMIICYITNPIVVLFADENGELHGFLKKWQTEYVERLIIEKLNSTIKIQKEVIQKERE